MKHMGVKYLFMQDVVAKKKAYVCKVHTDVNPSDIGTKWHSSTRLEILRTLVHHTEMKKKKNHKTKDVNIIGAITDAEGERDAERQ